MADNDLLAYKRVFDELEATYTEFYIKTRDCQNIDKTEYQMGYIYTSKKIILYGSFIQPIILGN